MIRHDAAPFRSRECESGADDSDHRQQAVVTGTAAVRRSALVIPIVGGEWAGLVRVCTQKVGTVTKRFGGEGMPIRVVDTGEALQYIRIDDALENDDDFFLSPGFKF